MKFSDDSPPPGENTRQTPELVREPDNQSMSHCCICACMSMWCVCVCVFVCVYVVTVNHVSRKSQMPDQLCQEGRGESVKERQGGNIINSSLSCWTITVEGGCEKMREERRRRLGQRTQVIGVNYSKWKLSSRQCEEPSCTISWLSRWFFFRGFSFFLSFF